MRKVTPTRSADWISVTARWLLIFAAILWLAFSVGFTAPVIIILALGAIINICLSIAHALDLPITRYRFYAVIGDALFAYALFYLTLPAGANMAWLGLLPLITAAIYFHWAGAIVLLFVNIIIQGVIAWFFAPPDDVIPFLIILVVLYLVIGAAVAYASRRWLTSSSRSSQRIQSAAGLEPSGRRQAIYELISELSSSLSYQRILENALSLSTNTLVELGAPVEDLVSMVLFFTDNSDNGTKLEIVTSQLLLSNDTHLMLPGVSGLIGHSIEEGLPEVSKNISTDPELSQFASLHEYKSAYCIPLRSGLEAYGVMVFSHPESDFFSSERREVLDIIGKQFVIAIQNAQLYQNLEQEKERMMTIQEDARKQMARDLHDGPTQAIAAIALRVNFARRLMERDEKAAAEELYKIEELARRTTKEIRHMLFTLRPLVLESKGLVAALEAMAEKMKDTFDQNVVIQVNSEAAEALGSSKQAVVFYLAEEAVNNARKHAQADHIWVNLRNVREGISILEVKDDGVGFDVQAVDAVYEERGSLGMVNMRERTELINGLLYIDSKVGGGTSVRIAIPQNEDAAEKLRRGM